MTLLDQLEEFKKTAPVNVEAAIRSLGLALVKEADLDEGISGQIRLLPNGGYEISASGREHYYRRRFTMAHELGHYVLHRDLIGKGIDDSHMYRSTELGNFYNTRIKQVHEAQANSFAASFLMPTELVVDAVRDGLDLDALIKRFLVSSSAMKWRLKSLGLDCSEDIP